MKENSNHSQKNKKRPSCSGCATGCIFLLLLFIALLCAFFSLFLPRQVHAAAPAHGPLSVLLLIDNSNSLFDKNGFGSDPDLLRIDAARLFIAYLGIDERSLIHRAGVIFFGSQPETAVPLTPLINDQQRQELAAAIANPPRMGWTDHLAALTHAQTVLGNAQHPALILLTDGKPEWEDTPNAVQQASYITQLQAKSADLAQANIPLFIILLANQATDADPKIAQIWQPLWQEMSAATPPGRFFIARQPNDLPGIYHDIAAALTGRQTAGVILDEAVPTAGKTETIQVAPGLAQLSLVISKSDPAQTITITPPDGRSLTESAPNVRRAGLPGQTQEEVWVIEQPQPGVWRIHINAPGAVTIWQDYIPALTPTPTHTAVPTSTPPPTTMPKQPQVSHSPTPSPTAVPTSSPTNTRTPPPTPRPLPPAKLEISAVPPPATPRLPWPLFILPLGALFTGIFLFTMQRRNKQAKVSGVIRIISSSNGPLQYDLDDRRQTSITLGQPPADIPLPGTAARITIRPGAKLGDAHGMLISGSGKWQLNGQETTRSTPLYDTDAITLSGGVKLRYENLPLRRAVRTFRTDD